MGMNYKKMMAQKQMEKNKGKNVSESEMRKMAMQMRTAKKSRLTR